MAYNPVNPNGQATSANSAPVVIASDQSAVPVTVSSGATSANQTNGTQQTRITDGTNIANVLSPGTANSTANALVTASTTQNVTYSTTTVQAVGSTDVGNYRWVSVQVNAQGTSSTITFQTSNDNSTWSSIALVNSTQTNNTGVTSTTSTGIYHGPLSGRYFRLNVTGISAGTTSGVIVFSTLPAQLQTIGTSASQGGTWTVGSNSATGSAFPANAFLMGIAGASNLFGLQSGSAIGDGGTATGAAAVFPTAYNGSTFDRVRTANGASATTGTGLLGTGSMVYDGTNWQKLTTNSTTFTAKSGADVNLLGTLGTAFSTAGKIDITAIPTGTNTIGNVTIVPSTSGGLLMNSATTGSTATAIKASAGQLYGWYIYNSNSTVAYVQIFNVASGSVTVGTTAPTISLGIPPQSGANMVFPIGMAFGTAMSYAVTTTRSGNTATASSVDVNFFYD